MSHSKMIYFLLAVKVTLSRLISRNKQELYVQINTEALSCNHCCRGKLISITYSECMSIALVIQHAKRMRRVM